MGITVHLRQRKQSNNGKISLYLEYYKGTTKTSDGKVRAVRDYEYLDLFLIDKPKTSADKEHNKKIYELAHSIKNKRELEIKNGLYGFTADFNVKALFLEYFSTVTENRKQSQGNAGNWKSALKHLTDFINKDYHQGLTFAEIDTRFCNAFKAYLNDRARTSAAQHLSSSSQNSYYAKFRACLRQAIKDKIILSNPSEGVVLNRVITHKREYLTHEELQRLVKAECRYAVLKRAFLFSCLTGLRWSDVHKLLWKEVQKSEDGWRITFHQQKTQSLQYLDIPQQARDLMGDQGIPEDRVFIGLSYSSYMNTALTQWMLRAGITKDITFHCGRHTFAVLQLEYGTDILTLRDLMGHLELKTTLIYTQIMDRKKIEAAKRIPSINL
jgi:integrase/recombinase XerD